MTTEFPPLPQMPKQSSAEGTAAAGGAAGAKYRVQLLAPTQMGAAAAAAAGGGGGAAAVTAARVAHVSLPTIPNIYASQHGMGPNTRLNTELENKVHILLQMPENARDGLINTLSHQEKQAVRNWLDQEIVRENDALRKAAGAAAAAVHPARRDALTVLRKALHTVIQQVSERDSIALQKIASRMEAVVLSARRTVAYQQPFELLSLDTSVNEVTRLEPEVHLLKKEIEARQPPVVVAGEKLRDHIEDAFRDGQVAINEALYMDPPRADEERRKLEDCFKDIKWKFGTLRKQGIANRDVALKFISDLREISKEKQNVYITRFIETLCTQLLSLDQTLSFKNVPIRYQKEGVLQELRKYRDTLGAVEVEKRARGAEAARREHEAITSESQVFLDRVINDISRHDGEFIKASFLEEVTKKHLSENPVLAKKIKNLGKTFPEYVSSYDMVVYNQPSKGVIDRLKEIAPAEFSRSAFGYKLGDENIKEVLAGKVADTLGLNTYLMPKSEQTIKEARLGATVAPKGLASRWIEGDIFPEKTWAKWIQAKHEYAKTYYPYSTLKRDYNAAKPQGTVPPILKNRYAYACQMMKKARSEKAKAAQEILRVGGLNSIAQHIVIDTILTAGDSHYEQYKQDKDGEFHNYDFARFFPPSSAYSSGDANTYALFRGYFLDHPLADAVMNEGSDYRDILMPLKELILSWDVNAIEKIWREAGLVGDIEFFQAQYQKASDLEVDLSNFLNRSVPYEQLCTKYGIPYARDQSQDQLQETLTAALDEKYRAIRRECWAKMDPRSVQEWKNRVIQAQHYLATDKAPTLKGMWVACYPEIARFENILERFERGTATTIFLSYPTPEEMARGVGRRRRPLESIITDAERGSYASPESVQTLRTTLAKLRRKCFDRLTSDLAASTGTRL